MWEQRIIANSMDPDDPPILPGWNLGTCEEFYTKAVLYGEGGGVVLPPAPIFNGVHPVGAATTQAVQQMQLDILTYLAVRNPGARVIGGTNGSVGLACSMSQFAIAFSQLSRLELEPWFRAVLDHGIALSGPLATMYIPRPKLLSGLCDPIPLACKLWT